MAEERLMREPSRAQSKVEKAELEQETQALIRLLGDYSMRARQLTSEYRRSLERRGLIFAAYMTTALLAALGAGAIYTLIAETGSNGSPISLMGSPFMVFLVVLIIVTLFGAYLAYTSLAADMRKRKLLGSEIENAATKLGRLIRMSSQAREHVATTRVQRLELELAITDAEGALLDAMEVSGGKSPSKIMNKNLP